MAETINIEWQGEKVFVPEELTPAQFAILKLAAKGKDQYEMAALMNYAVGTIRSYRTQLLKRMGVRSIQHAVALGYEKGWITHENQAA